MASAAKTISLIGFAARARKLLFGSFSCEKGVRSGKARLILADEGLSARSMKDVHNMCEYYSVPLVVISPEGELARISGMSCKMAAVTDEQFAEAILKAEKEKSM